MAKKPIIQQIWIINKAGITLYNQSIEDKIDPSKKAMMGSFLSGINQMAKNIEMGEFKTIKVGETRITFTSYKTELLFVGQSSTKIKENKVIQYIEKLKEQIIEHLGEKLNNWDGNADIFDEIDKFIDLKNQ